MNTLMHNTGTVAQASSRSPADRSHPAYIDAAYRSSTSCALQDTYTEVAWTDEALSNMR